MKEFLTYLEQLKADRSEQLNRVEIELPLNEEVILFLENWAEQEGITLDFLVEAILLYQIEGLNSESSTK